MDCSNVNDAPLEPICDLRTSFEIDDRIGHLEEQPQPCEPCYLEMAPNSACFHDCLIKKGQQNCYAAKNHGICYCLMRWSRLQIAPAMELSMLPTTCPPGSVARAECCRRNVVEDIELFTRAIKSMCTYRPVSMAVTSAAIGCSASHACDMNRCCQALGKRTTRRRVRFWSVRFPSRILTKSQHLFQRSIAKQPYGQLVRRRHQIDE